MPESDSDFAFITAAIHAACAICGEWGHAEKTCHICPACGSGLTVMSPPEDAARCLACLYLWSPSTRGFKPEPGRSC